MTIAWSERAIDRLREIHDFIAEESIDGAVAVMGRIFESVERLRAFPKSGRIVPEYERVDIREIIVAPYRVLYREDGERIEIVNVLHSRQQI